MFRSTPMRCSANALIDPSTSGPAQGGNPLTSVEFFLHLHGLSEGPVKIPPPLHPPFDINTFEPIDAPWPAIGEWVPADETDPQAEFQEDIVSTHWVTKESAPTAIAL